MFSSRTLADQTRPNVHRHPFFFLAFVWQFAKSSNLFQMLELGCGWNLMTLLSMVKVKSGDRHVLVQSLAPRIPQAFQSVSSSHSREDGRVCIVTSTHHFNYFPKPARNWVARVACPLSSMSLWERRETMYMLNNWHIQILGEGGWTVLAITLPLIAISIQKGYIFRP